MDNILILFAIGDYKVFYGNKGAENSFVGIYFFVNLYLSPFGPTRVSRLPSNR